jgi:tetratricopeptide (TPR) repeat protein
MAFYVRKTLVPTGLSAFYPLTRFKTNFWGRPFLLSAAIVLSVTLVCLLLRRRLPGLLLAWAACVVTLLPVSGLIQNGFQIAADRYSYLACLGFALLAGAILSLSWQRPRHSRTERVLIAGAALLILFSLSSLTLKQIAFWRNSDTLWTRAIAVEPSFIAHLNLGTSLSGQGDSVGAIQEYRQANVFWPDSAMAHNNLGKELLQLGLLEEATQELRRAVQLEPVPAAYNSLARALAMQGKLDEAIAALRQALRIDPKDANAGRNLQTILAIQERQEQGGAGTVSRDSR